MLRQGETIPPNKNAVVGKRGGAFLDSHSAQQKRLFEGVTEFCGNVSVALYTSRSKGFNKTHPAKTNKLI